MSDAMMPAAEVEAKSELACEKIAAFAAVAIATGGSADLDILGWSGDDPGDEFRVTFTARVGAGLIPGMRTILDNLAAVLAAAGGAP